MAIVKLLAIRSDGSVSELSASDVITTFPLTSKSTVSASAAINTTATYISTNGFVIPANSLSVGDSFEIVIYGTNTSTAAVLSTFTPRLGVNGTNADTALTTFTSTSATSGTSIPFEIIITVVVRSIGATGSIYSYGKLIKTGATGISTAIGSVSVGGLTTINTTQNLILGCSLVTAATTSTNTIQIVTVRKV